MAIAEIVGVVGGIAGLISLGILIYKTAQERPIISYEVVSPTHYYNPSFEHENFISFAISVKFHNKGSRSTTIHESTLDFDYGKHFHVPNRIQQPLSISPHSTVTQFFNFYVNKTEGPFKDAVNNCVLTIGHTFDTLKIPIENMKEFKK